MTDLFEKLIPIGMREDTWKNGIITSLTVPTVYSLGFMFKYYGAYSELFDPRTHELIEGAKMRDFFPLVGGSFALYFVCAIVLFAFVIYNYSYYRRGSNQTYLMRRLPDGFEWHRRAWTMPILSAVLVLAAGAVVLLIYYGFYMITTPVEAIQDGQWSRYNAFSELIGNIFRG